MILACNCTGDRRGNTGAASYQDAHYGPGQRVHNPFVLAQILWGRCTICGSGRQVSKAKAKG